MRKYDAVIWDWNGTLLDDVSLCLGIVNELLIEYKAPALTVERYKHIFDFPVRIYYERAGIDLSHISFEALSDKFCTRFEERLHLAPLFPSASAVLQSLRRAGCRQFLLSGTEHGALHRMLERYGLTGVFEAVQGQADGLGTGKLGAGVDLLVQSQIEPGKTLMIGDTAHDAEVAEALGIDCVLISSGHHSHERLSRLNHPLYRSLDLLAGELAPQVWNQPVSANSPERS